MKNATAGQGGFIKWIIIIVVALLALSYFGINLRQLVNQPTTQDNVSYVASTTVTVWDKYLKIPATYAWGIFVNLIWTPALHNLENMKDGKLTNINNQGTTTLPYTNNLVQ
jgi:hypothetical protein